MLEYLQILFAPYENGPCDTDRLCEIRCLPPLRRDTANVPAPRYFGLSRLERAADYARAMQGTCDVYVGVLPRAHARWHGAGGRDSDIHEAAWLWADIDVGAKTDAMGAFLRGLRERLPAPQMCVLSGSGGAHVYWRLSAPIALTDEKMRQSFADVQKRLCAALNIAAPDGIRADAAARNPSRILRVPGTWNHKREKPTSVTGILCAPTETRCFEEWENDLPCEPKPPAGRRNDIARILARSPRFGGKEVEPVPPSGLRAWASQGYPEGQRHSRLTGDAAWLRRDTDLPEPLARELFRCKAEASPGTHPLTETELERIWRWA